MEVRTCMLLEALSDGMRYQTLLPSVCSASDFHMLQLRSGLQDCDMGADGTFIFGDSGLEQNPDPEKLAISHFLPQNLSEL